MGHALLYVFGPGQAQGKFKLTRLRSRDCLLGEYLREPSPLCVDGGWLGATVRCMSLDLHRRQDLRSLALHRKAVRVLKEHPEKAARALQVLERWQAKRDAHCSPLWDEWKRIIEGRLWKNRGGGR